MAHFTELGLSKYLHDVSNNTCESDKGHRRVPLQVRKAVRVGEQEMEPAQTRQPHLPAINTHISFPNADTRFFISIARMHMY